MIGHATTAAESSADLAATGQAIPVLAVLIAVGVALLLRAGRSKLEDPGDEHDDPTDAQDD